MLCTKFSLKALVLLAFLSVPGLARFGVQRRLVCTQDDLYTMFHSAPPEDIDYWCSSYIGLSDVQSSTDAYTVRTTTVTTTTTYTPYSHTTTIPDYIATVTITEGQIRKRVAAPSPTPAAELATLYSAVPVLVECEETAANKSLISSVSSGCSCLFIMPRTIPFLATTTTTRTETAVDYEPSNVYTTETGYSQKTVTVLPTPIGNYTFPGSTGALSTTYTLTIPYISGSPAPSISMPDPKFPNITNSGDRNGPTGEPTSSPTTTLPQNLTTMPGPTAPSLINTTDLSPYPTNTTDLWPYPTNTTDLWPYPTNTTLPTNPSASITPSNSLNSTAYPSITPTPSYNLTSTPSGFPITLANYTTPTSNATATGASRGFHSYPTANASICTSTEWITGYTSACVSTSTVVVTSWATPANGSFQTTITNIVTLGI